MNIRERWLPRGQIITIVLLVVVVLLVGWTTVDRFSERESRQVAEEELRLAEDNAAALAAQVRVECERRSVIARELGDLCRTAERVESEPTAPIPGPPPTAEEIEAAVETVLTERPGLIRSELIAAVTAHLTRNPPDPGRDAPPPTTEQVFAAVASQLDSALATFCATRDDCRGDDAPALTQAEVDAAFQRFCADDACRGDDGEDSTVPGPAGADGRGIVSIVFVNGGDCRMIITYDKPDANGDIEQVIGGMPASMCKADE
jgi:hypothetical protein